MRYRHYIGLWLSFIFFVWLNEAHAQQEPIADTLKSVILPEAIATGNERTHRNVTVIRREKLDIIQSKTLGETLSHIPGVQNSYFGPHSGTPVIRSLSGNRVKVLSNGLPLNDFSGISPNLNVTVDMDNLLEMEVYKGSASVLYGGKAIGGAVDMKDNTIPATISEKKWYGHVLTEAGTNSGHRQALDINGNSGKYWAWHIGGMNQGNKDLKIPGNTKAPIAYDPNIDNLTATMAQVHVDAEMIHNISLYPYLNQYVLDRIHDPKYGFSEDDLYTLGEYSTIGGQQVKNPPNDKYIPGQDPNTPFYTRVVHGIHDYAPVTKGVMPNSHSDSRSVNLGTSYIREKFRMGIGYRASEGYYGIPGFARLYTPSGHSHSHDHSHDHLHSAPVAYQPINTRALSQSALFEMAYRPSSSAISAVRLNYVMQASDDRELIDIYRVNDFNSKRHALRTEMELKARKFWKSVNGLDFTRLKIKGDGIQRYLPNNQSREAGAFTLQQFSVKPVFVNLGYRHDWVMRKVLPDPTYQRSRGLSGGNLSDRDFRLNHFTTDMRWNFWEGAFVKASYNHAERAPEVNELYAGNDHFAIMLEENGDDRLNKETAKSYEFGAGLNYKGLYVTTSYYHTSFENYLYLAHTGISRSGGFLVKEWRGSTTEITGWETELTYKSMWLKKNTWEISSFFDLVKNKNTSDNKMRKWAEGDYMPNLPTSRYGISAAMSYNKFVFSSSFNRYLEQHYLGKNINPEPPMPAYSLLAARLSYNTSFFGYGLELYAYGNNLLNVEARPQNSFLKYLAPLPGRNISLGIKAKL